MRTSRRRTLIALVPLALMLAACGGGDDKADDPPAEPAAKPAAEEPEASTTSWVAQATVAEVAVYDGEGDTEADQTLTSPNEHGVPLVFLVDSSDEPTGDRFPVHLPVRPNGSKGWVDAADVVLQSHDYRVTVDVGDRKLTVTNADETVIDTEIGIGKDDAPTPGGIYYVKELLQPPDPNGAYGPYAFGLSGFSNELDSLNGKGTGVIGIHGTNDPDSIGNNVSHGCIRIDNDVVTEMASFLPLGTPVDINA